MIPLFNMYHPNLILHLQVQTSQCLVLQHLNVMGVPCPDCHKCLTYRQ